MRKTLVAATTAAVLLGASQVPAVAAEPEIPTDVQVSWADLAKQDIRVTWKDNGEQNFVMEEIDGLVLNPGSWLVRQDAGGNNEVILKSGFFHNRDKVRITVRNKVSGDSPRAASVWFDTKLPVAPKLVGAKVLADLSLKLSWTQPKVVDSTPNDPLDRPASDETLAVTVGTEKVALPLGSTATTIPARSLPYVVQLVAANEWGQATPDPYLTFGTMTAGLRIDPLVNFLDSANFDLDANARTCSGCAPIYAGGGQVSYLQSRVDASKPWKTIGRYNGGSGPRLSYYVGSYGGQQYRVYIPAWAEISKEHRIVTPPSSTSARYSATQTKFLVAGFNTLNARVGQVLTTTVRIQPEPTIKASLQWYDGKVWHHAAYIPLTKGRGTLSIKAAGRGTTRYWRVAVPKMSFNGKPIVATGSRAFKLTVR
ncbi:hypothetical protein [Streptomyces sp. SID13031]|uniref:hypothetical protein n=1 Tax=Streptomyces sp. SID13031 TaxID=2706046 RepID=UPI0013CA3466|nr:hypothetical protein [Streptomyces sp. SID13031]NEA31901.1 hypothetical protein [Streptomyces sp. SID13031]